MGEHEALEEEKPQEKTQKGEKEEEEE